MWSVLTKHAAGIILCFLPPSWPAVPTIPPTTQFSITSVNTNDNSVTIIWKSEGNGALDDLDKLTVRIQKQSSEGTVLETNNYTINPSTTPTTICAGKLESKTPYLVCLVWELKTGVAETDCEQVSTTDNGDPNPDGCLDPSSTVIEQQNGEESSDSSTGVCVNVVLCMCACLRA